MARVRDAQLEQEIRRGSRRQGREPRDPRQGIRRFGRTIGLRQDDDPAHGRGAREDHAGEISIGDKVVNELPPMDRDIAMVFQNYALYPHMSVYDNMAFGLKMRKFAKPEIAAACRRQPRFSASRSCCKRKPRQLSGGQRQRVALGRAIVRHPQVFLFDEPLSNLDAKLRVQMRVELKQLHERLGTTAIYVTHDQVEAMTLGDRVVVMRDGWVQQVGEPLELYSTPANVRRRLYRLARDELPARSRSGRRVARPPRDQRAADPRCRPRRPCALPALRRHRRSPWGSGPRILASSRAAIGRVSLRRGGGSGREISSGVLLNVSGGRAVGGLCRWSRAVRARPHEKIRMALSAGLASFVRGQSRSGVWRPSSVARPRRRFGWW